MPILKPFEKVMNRNIKNKKFISIKFQNPYNLILYVTKKTYGKIFFKCFLKNSKFDGSKK